MMAGLALLACVVSIARIFIMPLFLSSIFNLVEIRKDAEGPYLTVILEMNEMLKL